MLKNCQSFRILLFILQEENTYTHTYTNRLRATLNKSPPFWTWRTSQFIINIVLLLLVRWMHIKLKNTNFTDLKRFQVFAQIGLWLNKLYYDYHYDYCNYSHFAISTNINRLTFSVCDLRLQAINFLFFKIEESQFAKHDVRLI